MCACRPSPLLTHSAQPTSSLAFHAPLQRHHAAVYMYFPPRHSLIRLVRIPLSACHPPHAILRMPMHSARADSSWSGSHVSSVRAKAHKAARRQSARRVREGRNDLLDWYSSVRRNAQHAVAESVMSGNVMSGNVMSGNVMSGSGMSGVDSRWAAGGSAIGGAGLGGAGFGGGCSGDGDGLGGGGGGGCGGGGSIAGSMSGSNSCSPRQAGASNSASGLSSPEARAAAATPEARVAATIAAARAASNYTPRSDARGNDSTAAAATPRPFSAAPGDRTGGLDEPAAGGMRVATAASTTSTAVGREQQHAEQQQRPRPSTASHGMFHLFAGSLTDSRPETAETLYVGGAGWSREAPGSNTGAALLGCRLSASSSRPPSRPFTPLSVTRGAQGHRIMTTASLARRGAFNETHNSIPMAARGISR